jgi:hypothetical protein
MRDPIEVQHELDEAQADLEDKVGQLKQLIDHKLDTPRHIIEAVEKPLAFVRAHAAVIAAAVVGFGVIVFAIRRLGRGTSGSSRATTFR